MWGGWAGEDQRKALIAQSTGTGGQGGASRKPQSIWPLKGQLAESSVAKLLRPLRSVPLHSGSFPASPTSASDTATTLHFPLSPMNRALSCLCTRTQLDSSAEGIKEGFLEEGVSVLYTAE